MVHANEKSVLAYINSVILLFHSIVIGIVHLNFHLNFLVWAKRELFYLYNKKFDYIYRMGNTRKVISHVQYVITTQIGTANIQKKIKNKKVNYINDNCME